jgi:hypothetical protein
MSVSDMREPGIVAGILMSNSSGSINVSMAVELTVEVRRPHGMNGPAVEMSRFTVEVIRIGVDMEEGNREHPQGRPGQEGHAKPRKSFTLCLHYFIKNSTSYPCIKSRTLYYDRTGRSVKIIFSALVSRDLLRGSKPHPQAGHKS